MVLSPVQRFVWPFHMLVSVTSMPPSNTVDSAAAITREEKGVRHSNAVHRLWEKECVAEKLPTPSLQFNKKDTEFLMRGRFGFLSLSVVIDGSNGECGCVFHLEEKYDPTELKKCGMALAFSESWEEEDNCCQRTPKVATKTTVSTITRNEAHTNKLTEQSTTVPLQ